MKKLIAKISLLLALFFLFPINSLADENFQINTVVTYRVDPSGRTRVTHEVSLSNLNSSTYATSYSISLGSIEAENIEAIDDQGKLIPLTSQKDQDTLVIKLNFPDNLVGKAKNRKFSISYDNSKFAVRTGEIWEISIPKLGETETTGDYNVKLVVPDSFGLEAYMSPKADTLDLYEDYKYYSFSKDELIETGITAGFGQFQVFSFNLFYHLENPLPRSADTYIAVPPDTAYQRMYINKIEPRPETIQIDDDGNWIAKYKLKARQRVDVNVSGSVQIFSGNRSFPKPSEVVLKSNLKEDNFWQVNDPKIQELSKRYKTPEEIYNYVVSTLKYDFERVQPNVQRMGAVSALEKPESAICMEFTDLFIAIARAAGIPAREINGYAYTENKDLQPLGLVADVLHSWPEYWDQKRGVWVPVDPTWGSTSGGVDYFNKLDLRHFTFVIHGGSSTTPYPPGSYKLGANPQKDVYVSFGQLPEKKVPQLSLTLTPFRNIPFFDILYTLKIKNLGPSSAETLTPQVYFDGKPNSRDFIHIMPPYSNYKKIITVPYSFLGRNTPDKVSVSAGHSKVELNINKTKMIINSLVVIFLLFLTIVLAILIRIKRFTLYAKFISKFQKTKTT